jgi:ABC-type bacteriocin/lantibiotic exporter with double-glycine peptidase domain
MPTKINYVFGEGTDLLSLFTRKVPFKSQLSNDDCAASCLSMILAYHKNQVSVSSCAKRMEQYGPPVQLTTLARTSASYNLSVKIKSTSIDELSEQKLPCIVHWNFNHFVVLEKITNDAFFIVDPAVGQRKVNMSEFNLSYTGAMLELQPNSDFDTGHVEENSAFRRFLYQSLVTKANVKLFLSLLALSGLLQAAALTYPALTLYFVDTVIPFKIDSLGMPIMIILGFLAIHVGFLNYIRAIIIVKFQAIMDKTLVSGFLDKLLKLPLEFHTNRSAGDIQSRLNSHTAIRSFFSTYTLTSLIDFITVITYSLFLFFISTEIALLTLTLATVILLTQLVYNNSLKEKSHAELKTQATYQSYLIEILSGIELIKGSASEKTVKVNWDKKLQTYINSIRNKGLLDAKAVSMTRTLEIMSPAIIFSYSIVQYFIGNISLGTIIAANSICIMALAPISSLLNHIRMFQLVKAHMNRISELWLHEDEVYGDLPLPTNLHGARLSFKDVSFKYKRSGQTILDNLNVEFTLGTKVSITGPSGAGKSTMLSLIMGLSRPTSGDILLNGESLYKYDLSQYRQKIGFVAQSNFVFNASIKDNITFGHGDIELEQVKQITEKLGLHQEIEKLPMKYESLAGQNGGKLSGGQRQRLGIARALVNNPEIVVLDEATSSLDSINETKVANLVLSYGNTQFVVSHRISTICNSDLIIVLNNEGHMEASGTHDSLTRSNNFYRQCSNNQSQPVSA